MTAQEKESVKQDISHIVASCNKLFGDITGVTVEWQEVKDVGSVTKVVPKITLTFKSV